MPISRLTLSLFATALGFLWPVFVIGGVQWLILRHYMGRAALWWFPILAGATVLGSAMMSGIAYVMSILFGMGLVTMGWPPGLNAAFLTMVVQGAGLWWLVATHARLPNARQQRQPVDPSTNMGPHESAQTVQTHPMAQDEQYADTLDVFRHAAADDPRRTRRDRV